MPHRGGGAGASNDVGEQQPPEEEEVQQHNVNRFLQQRKHQNVDSSYHPTHDKKAVAKIPPLQRGESSNQREREEVLMVMPLNDVHPRDVATLKQHAPHLPDDTALEVLARFDYDIDVAIAEVEDMVKPSLMPAHLKNFIVANVAMEKDFNPTRRLTWKEFYHENLLKGTVDTKTLVDFYYREKNKIGGNWRLEYDEPPETPEQKAELERKIANAGITIITRDAATIRQLRTTRPVSVPTRQSARTRRSEVELLRNDSDTDSASGTPLNGASSSASTSQQPSTSGEPPPKIRLRIRFTPGQMGAPPSNISIINSDNQPSTSSAPTSRSGNTHRPPAQAAETPRRRHSSRLSSGASLDQPPQTAPSQNPSPQRSGALKPNRKRKSNP